MIKALLISAVLGSQAIANQVHSALVQEANANDGLSRQPPPSMAQQAPTSSGLTPGPSAAYTGQSNPTSHSPRAALALDSGSAVIGNTRTASIGSPGSGGAPVGSSHDPSRPSSSISNRGSLGSRTPFAPSASATSSINNTARETPRMDYRYELYPIVVGQRPKRQSASAVPIRPAPSVGGREKAKKSPTFTQYSDLSWKTISRYEHLSEGRQWGKIVPVYKAVGMLFDKIATSVEHGSNYDVKFQALDAMLNIWDHCIALQGSVIGKDLRDSAHDWMPQFIRVLDTATPEDLHRLANELYPTEPPILFLMSALTTLKEAKSYCMPLMDQLLDAIDPILDCQVRIGPPPPGGTRDEPVVLD